MGVERAMKRIVAAAVLAVFPSLAATETKPFWFERLAQNAPTNFERFQLWNDCRPVELLVEHLSDDAAKIGLTRDRVETLTRSRLRAARIYTDETEAYLQANITVVGSSFNIKTKFRKLVTDRASTELFFATTWELGSTGTHGQDAGFILQGLSEYVDGFIDEYLRVNEEAC